MPLGRAGGFEEIPQTRPDVSAMTTLRHQVLPLDFVKLVPYRVRLDDDEAGVGWVAVVCDVCQHQVLTGPVCPAAAGALMGTVTQHVIAPVPSTRRDLRERGSWAAGNTGRGGSVARQLLQGPVGLSRGE